MDTQFSFQFFGRDVLAEPDTQSRLALYAPSVGLLQRVQRKLIYLDDLSWREFEQLIANMLEAEGYSVELMKGSKDGGVDVVAIKDLGNTGLFKSVWQAKKHRLDRKVGLSLVRELSDTRLEHGASKGIIVTTSFLTSGALGSVEIQDSQNGMSVIQAPKGVWYAPIRSDRCSMGEDGAGLFGQAEGPRPQWKR
ncbi:restriction endonuclease [Bradyrhizobium diazoefficiens]|uniref:restriction endonuclease n=1 Tax=Bradyrhizobium diazoefficiens TaxID=1355477 RepID=UPI00190DA195|nr:restriction endonuclease [Bradyrhizobium diazoefficiens]MBK3665442.1 restriction endonuclease [Bradyrhizobium diazoefficiens]